MFILFTSEENGSAEKKELIHFFENGLPLLHVRKPGMTEEDLKIWLSQFDEKHLRKMVLHQHHHLAEILQVKGINIKESFRSKKEDLKSYIERFQSEGLTVSSSFHDPEKVKKEASAFDYIFLSPVFTSVSKTGYEGQAFRVENFPHKVIALGGIEIDKILKAKKMGYSGVAVMGGVWLSGNKHKAFTEIFKEYRNVYQ
ncbi:thiamine phosphate synthase [Antarcticibacterium sp. 1MA-6-2]|uniref:thiamine phosphate synthase n=1 Tax=Antarcticibacterium sp. 1MA-6-2 TaxID=2908210 RepID=UPI001F17AB05|nr:thiamine phosphate synthase [Antarcticibacterium sp. 1MA-6-2]UJH92071.1 thiamine phosphate synthase [Antarcticibacterium sp. 1MA-6-2]